MFFRTKKSGRYEYLQIVENRWEDGAPKQRVITTVGRLDQLRESGGLERLLASGARFSDNALLILAHRDGTAPVQATRSLGPAMIFERLWVETGCAKVIDELAKDRLFAFPVERAIFITVLHRIMASGSDRAAMAWLPDQVIQGVHSLELHHVYRSMAWLGEKLPDNEQKDATHAAPRCVKDQFEERLFSLRRHLFSSLDLVFFDTTSIYFEGEGGESLGQHGHSKDSRPDLHQMVVGVILNEEGHPVACELWPGNTSDVTTLIPVAKRLTQRFGIHHVCLVADRGMISAETITTLEKEGWSYILGARMRNQKEVRDTVLTQPETFQVVHPESKRQCDPSPLKVMEVMISTRRYVVCLNDAQARKDAADREAIVTALREQLKQGEKSLVGNKGYRRFLASDGANFSIDEEKIADEARYDGKWVLRTNTDLSPRDVALRYKQLWMVEATFRSAKTLLATRPVYHRQDETIRGHVFCSFLALILRKALLDHLDQHGVQTEWSTILSDLVALQEVEIQQDGKRFLLRTEARGVAGKVFQAVGVAMPPAVRNLTSATT